MKSFLLILSIFVSLGSIPLTDLGPKPIKDTGIWNDPTRFRLVDNYIDIILRKKHAEIQASFLFVSTYKLNYWDKGKLEWAWPLPDNYPIPTEFNVHSRTKISWSDQEAIDRFRTNPSDLLQKKYLKSVTLEYFDQIGISRWYIFQDEFLMYMPAPFLVVEAIVTYKQDYNWDKNGFRELIYILRTGSLWSNSIEKLKISVASKDDVELVSCNWDLDQGRILLNDADPDRDLIIKLSNISSNNNIE